jgi:aspartate kinase
MPLIVQKFGGTSVADSEKILGAARKAVRAHQDGNQVVMVVSAMGKNTDMLLGQAQEINERPPAREMDMLLSTGEQVSVALMAMAVDRLGFKAISLTGAQIGIRTDSTHTKARIKSISTDRVRHLLDEGNIVIAAGFQGIDEDFNITTLGRGGSDTTAVALAAVLGADVCEIYTDVDGVYTTDPRMLPEARRLGRISYDEMLEFASVGAGVMHSRSIEFGKKYSVPIHVRSSFTDSPGTVIAAEPESLQQPVSGAAATKNEARISILGVPDVPGASFEVFSRLAERAISVDMIVQNVGDQGKADISFTVPKNELPRALEAVNDTVEQLEAEGCAYDADVAKISIVGLGMAEQTGVADQAFRALAAAGINLQMITTGEIKISALVDRVEALPALRAVHEAFSLHKEPPHVITPAAAAADLPLPSPAKADAADVVSRLQGVDMEELIIDDISLDQTQARVTIRGVPDQPGLAAKVFDEIAEAGIFVDMIVQSHGREGRASISFTVPGDRLADSVRVCQKLASSLDCGTVNSSPAVAKLSVLGVGLRSHTGVAIRMFRSLAEAGINVEMINTSEVRVNVVVDGTRGHDALAALQEVFADAMH